jgi:hypothetical protein
VSQPEPPRDGWFVLKVVLIFLGSVVALGGIAYIVLYELFIHSGAAGT